MIKRSLYIMAVLLSTAQIYAMQDDNQSTSQNNNYNYNNNHNNQLISQNSDLSVSVYSKQILDKINNILINHMKTKILPNISENISKMNEDTLKNLSSVIDKLPSDKTTSEM